MKTCDHCTQKIANHNTTGRCGHHQYKWQNMQPISTNIACQRIVKIAVMSGILPKLDGSIDCVDCGEPATGYDHRDYMKPLDVDPVCSKCNVRRGAALNNIKPEWGEKEFLAKYPKLNSGGNDEEKTSD